MAAIGRFFGAIGRGWQGLLRNIADYIRETDKLLLILCTIASLYGCALIYSATPGSNREFFVQLASLGLGLCVAVFVSLFDYKTLMRFWYVYIGVGLVLLGLTFVFGYAPQGSDNKAWLELPMGMSLQVSELIKIFGILTFAKHVSALPKEKINRPVHVLLLAMHGVTPAGLIMVLQGDIGTVAVMLVIFVCMMVTAGVRVRYFLIGGVIALLAGAAVWLLWYAGAISIPEYIIKRFTILADLESDARGLGYQQLQGLKALGAGGLFGSGYLQGAMTQSSAVPKAYNDFIFTVAGEELGLVGALAVVLILLLIIVRIAVVGSASRDIGGKIICAGAMGMFAAQTIINIGMCLAVMPVIGVTLPFFSAGGSSLVCLFISIGLVTSVHTHRNARVMPLRDEKQRI